MVSASPASSSSTAQTSLTEVIAQQHGDRCVSVHEKFLEWTPDRMVVWGRYDPGIDRAPRPMSDHLVLITKAGSPSATASVVPDASRPRENVFGPLIAGPERCC